MLNRRRTEQACQETVAAVNPAERRIGHVDHQQRLQQRHLLCRGPTFARPARQPQLLSAMAPAGDIMADTVNASLDGETPPPLRLRPVGWHNGRRAAKASTGCRGLQVVAASAAWGARSNPAVPVAAAATEEEKTERRRHAASPQII